MMKEIEKFMSECGVAIGYRVINLGGKFLYIEGLKSVVSFGEEQMDFALKRSMLEVKGKNLKIKYLDKTTCTLEGDISSVVVK